MKLGECSCCSTNQAPQRSSLFERRHWLYAFFREHVFRDHTEEIRRALFPAEGPHRGMRVLELGCGPGLYSRKLARMFPDIETIGVDQSLSLLDWARTRARQSNLRNCSFCHDDACDLHNIPEPVDAVVVSRLFLIVRDRETVLSEIHRVLKPGGKCFLAEPTTPFRTRLPLLAMQISEMLNGGEHERQQQDFRPADVMSADQFSRLVHSRPWQHVETVQRHGYQYAVCTKHSALS